MRKTDPGMQKTYRVGQDENVLFAQSRNVLLTALRPGRARSPRFPHFHRVDGYDLCFNPACVQK